MIPAYYDAKDDRALRGVPLIVYLHLLDMLSPTEWGEVKQLALCSRLAVSARSLRYALRLLVAHGYLKRHKQSAQPGAPRLYRLVYKRMP